MYSTRDKSKLIQKDCRQSSQIEEQYKAAKELINLYAHSSFYEISHQCNLRCEGCYFFDDDSYIQKKEAIPIEEWERLYRKEKERGILVGSFFGAEPAMEQERLKLAMKYIPYGNIGTNGTIKISEEILYRIHISVWGGKVIDDKLRGKSTFDIALKNYTNDPRAIVAYTLNSMNLNDVEEVIKRCEDHGLPITFSMYSPAKGFVKAQQTLNTLYPENFLINTNTFDKNLLFTEKTLLETRDVIDAMIEKYPKTVYYTHDLNHFSTQSGPLFRIDKETGIALDCGTRLNENYRRFSVTTEEIVEKCVHSSLECSECRVYGAVASSLLMPSSRDLSSETMFQQWLDLMAMIEKIFVYRPLHNRSK